MARRDFFDWTGPSQQSVDVGFGDIALPIRYWRTDCFMALFSADLEAARALLPSQRLHPVRISPNRAIVAIAAFNYLETSVGPYGEIALSPLVSLDRPAPPALPLAAGVFNGLSAFVAHLPVTSRIARQAGRTVWGYPKFVADMDFDLRPESQQVRLSEGGRDILTLNVRRSGNVLLEKAPLTTYTVKDERLIRTEVAMRGHVATSLGPRSGSLALGDHPVAKEIAALGVGAKPLLTRTYLSHSAILPIGADIGPADRTYQGFQGNDADFARHTLRYDEGVVQTISEPGLLTAPQS